ncbi:MAG: pentapeptide repeat-containing protein [Alphaproteobacteria bacterium CG_4_9_14_3_um_filter_47_13]|nr:MAG: pentapeptide repeat-containing protein [Alphaproteobacteria bacterium CG_4_9_14_3_um_filter_47_13]
MTVKTAINESSLEQVTQRELEDIIKKHTIFLKGIRGGARAVLKFRDMSGLKFQGADLSQADFTGSILQGADLSWGTFTGASFFASDLRNACLVQGDFSRADFRGACVSGADLTGADLEKADLREGKVMERNARGILTDKDWGEGEPNRKKTIFTGAKLRDTNLSGSRAATADFSDADLSGVLVKNADFSGANLQGANLSDADFTGSNLSNSNLASSIMTGTILVMTETGGSNIKEATTEDSMGIKFEVLEQTLPELLEAHTKWVATAGKHGERLDLSGYDMRSVSGLGSYSLTAIKAIGTNFLKQNLEGTQIQSALLDRADLRDCKLMKTDLRGSSLRNALLSRADLSGAQLSPLKFINQYGMEWLQRVDLSGANLRYAILRGTNLSDAILAGADLSYAILIDCDLRRADLSGALLENTDMENTMIQGASFDEK